MVEKLTIINLLVAFPYAVKNYLRDDHSYEAEDIKDLISPLSRPTIAAPRLEGCVNNGFLQVPSLSVQKNGKDEPVLLGVSVELSGSGMNLSRASSRKYMWRAHAAVKQTNIPLEILLYVSSYVHKLAKNEAVPFIYSSPMNSGEETEGTLLGHLHYLIGLVVKIKAAINA